MYIGFCTPWRLSVNVVPALQQETHTRSVAEHHSVIVSSTVEGSRGVAALVQMLEVDVPGQHWMLEDCTNWSKGITTLMLEPAGITSALVKERL